MTSLAAPYRRAILALILLFGILGVTSTYTRMSLTDDEGFHIVCGMEWLKDGTYKTQPLHPPLARVVDALFPYLMNSWYGNESWAGDNPRTAYISKMVLSRLGTLPFYILSCILVYIWSRRLFGEIAALFSLGIYTTLSSVSAHAALATTDMTYTAIFLWALMCGIDWLRLPNRKNSLLLGLSLGIMIGTKYSGLAQWPAAMGMIFFALCIFNFRQPVLVFPISLRHIINSLLYSLPLIVSALALIFRFDFKPLEQGIIDAQNLNSHGFSVWLYKNLHFHGVWLFFPIVFFFKTPLSFLAATIVGNGRVIRDFRENNSLTCLYPLLAAIGVMLVSMTSNINLGVRHILPLYPLLSISAGYGLAWLWQGKKRVIAIALIGCQLFSFINTYPEHIAYFNFLAGDNPEHITLDSDFDWGQDMILLDETLQARGITDIYMCARRDAYWSAAKIMHAHVATCPETPVTGWIAVGRAYRLLNPNKIAWLQSFHAVQIQNSTMDLYYIPQK